MKKRRQEVIFAAAFLVLGFIVLLLVHSDAEHILRLPQEIFCLVAVRMGKGCIDERVKLIVIGKTGFGSRYTVAGHGHRRVCGINIDIL